MNDSPDLVSIITPMYNSEKYIRDTIDSVIKQDYKNWELIIVDDGSNDESVKIVEEYMLKEKRIRLIRLERNKGVSNARNVGINLAQGRFIAFLDSDDLWHSNKLSKQIGFMKTTGYSFTYAGYELIDEEGKNLKKIINVPKSRNYKQLLRGNAIGCLTVVIDREKIPNIRMPDVRHEDYATWLNILKNGTIAYGLQENLALYRKSVSSLSSNKLKSAVWTWKIYRQNQKLGIIKSGMYLIMYIFSAIIKYSIAAK